MHVTCLDCCFVLFFFQAEDGIRDLVRSRGLGDVYKRQVQGRAGHLLHRVRSHRRESAYREPRADHGADAHACLLYTSDAADDLLCVDLGGRRIIKKKTHHRAYHDDMSTYVIILH